MYNLFILYTMIHVIYSNHLFSDRYFFDLFVSQIFELISAFQRDVYLFYYKFLGKLFILFIDILRGGLKQSWKGSKWTEKSRVYFSFNLWSHMHWNIFMKEFPCVTLLFPRHTAHAIDPIKFLPLFSFSFIFCVWHRVPYPEYTIT